MKALVLNNIKELEYKEVPNPTIKDDFVLIKVKACGICSSDLDRYNFSGAYHYPIILGHEISGYIVECGKNIDKSYIGKNVVVFPLLPCKGCENCKNGNYAQCSNYDYFGSRRDGGYAEFLSAPVWNIKEFDKNISYSAAALAEPAAVAWHSVSKLPDIAKNVLVVGSGTIGILIGFWAKFKGITPYFYVRNDKKITYLRDLGFNNFVNTLSEDKFDSAVECVGTEDSLNTCLEKTKTKGTIVLTGNPKSDITLNRKLYWKILRQELTLTGVWNSIYEDDWDFVLKYSDKIPYEKLITHKYELKDGIKAFEELSKSDTFKIKGVFID